MKDKMTIEYTDSDFSQAIEEQFFSGERLAQFRFMNVERKALWLLWDAKEIEFFGYRYDSRWIRRNLMENLTQTCSISLSAVQELFTQEH